LSFFFSSRRRHTRCLSDWSSDVCSSDLQLFAQVTNPPIDPIREEMVMSLISYIGTERNILDEAPENCHTLKLPHPILTNRDLERSEERRVGKEWRSRAAARICKKGRSR